jgi:hypothetical protein
MADYSAELEKAVAFSFNELRKNKGDVARLPIELQTVVRVVSASGVFGNGGLQYFVERDWEGNPPLSSLRRCISTNRGERNCKRH